MTRRDTKYDKCKMKKEVKEIKVRNLGGQSAWEEIDWRGKGKGWQKKKK